MYRYYVCRCVQSTVASLTFISSQLLAVSLFPSILQETYSPTVLKQYLDMAVIMLTSKVLFVAVYMMLCVCQCVPC